MKLTTSPSAFAVGLLFLLVGMACAQPPTGEKRTFPKVMIGGSEVRTMRSSSTGRDYDLYIHLPSNYGQDKSKKYPVLYILDGQWDFKLMDSVLGGLVYDKFVPEMILVGIAYSGENPDYDGLRAMDYTPTPVPDKKGSGDGPKFLKFLKTELIPFTEANYQVDPTRRVLQGSSLGGLFTLYTMFSEPGFFSAYIAASPAVSYDNDSSFKQEAEYARSQGTTSKAIPGSQQRRKLIRSRAEIHANLAIPWLQRLGTGDAGD